MIEVDQLSKDYGNVTALDGVSFRIGQGEVVGFLGPNGAGKSTTLRIIAGFIGASSGRVRVAGYDVREDPIQARKNLGYMPETSPLYPEMRVREYLGFRAALKQVPRRKRRHAVGRAMELARVDDMGEVLVGQLSKGYRQRTALADALVADPPLLLLDEPTAGLDPNQILEVRALIETLAKERTVFLSTHILSEVEATCERAIVIHQGRLVAEGAIAELRERESSRSARLTLHDPKHVAPDLVRGFEGVATVQANAGPSGAPDVIALEVEFAMAADEGIERLLPRLVEHGVGIREARVERARLEDVFRSLTQDPARAEGA